MEVSYGQGSNYYYYLFIARSYLGSKSGCEISSVPGNAQYLALLAMIRAYSDLDKAV